MIGRGFGGGGSNPLGGGGGGNPFGGGKPPFVPPGGDPFGDSRPDIPKDAPRDPGQFHVIPGGDAPKPLEQRGIVPAQVVPSDGAGTQRPLVIPQDGSAKPDTGLLHPVIHVVVFARYPRPEGEEIIKSIGYFHAMSGDDFHLVLAGYSLEKPSEPDGRLSDAKAIALPGGVTWYYDDESFVSQVRMVAGATTWEYDGGLQLIICDAMVAGRSAATTREIFAGGRGRLERVIVIDVDEIKEKKLFSDFDHFFAKLSNLIREVRAERTERPTWELSDKLGLTQGGVLLKTLVKAFKLSWDEAVESAVSLKSFAVRDIRKKKS